MVEGVNKADICRMGPECNIRRSAVDDAEVRATGSLPTTLSDGHLAFPSTAMPPSTSPLGGLFKGEQRRGRSKDNVPFSGPAVWIRRGESLGRCVASTPVCRCSRQAPGQERSEQTWSGRSGQRAALRSLLGIAGR